MSLRHLLDTQGFAVLDGGFSTTLEASGYQLHKKLWSGYAAVDNPAGVVEVHRQFIDAGADIITTCSYQMSYEGFAANDIDVDGTNLLLEKSIALAREAVAASSRSALVAASIGTYGAHLGDGSEYSGHYGRSVSQLMDWHRPKFNVLVSSAPNILACETVPCIDEVKALTNLLLSASERSDLSSAWISMACRSGQELNSGDTLEDAIRAIEDPAIDLPGSGCLNSKFGIGINCTNPVYIESLIDIIASTCHKSRSIVAYPNSGETWDGERKVWMTSQEEECTSSEEFNSTLISSWRDAGATVIGGCCRSSPATIAGVRRTLLR